MIGSARVASASPSRTGAFPPAWNLAMKALPVLKPSASLTMLPSMGWKASILSKMDIEGAEDAALFGTNKTIRRFRPKLAISAYHKREDMIVLSRRLLDILPEYLFCLEHYTIHSEETVQYATAVSANHT